MRIVVLGGGVIGVTTAYYLAADGHEVVVLDRQKAVGQETSFANAGLIAPGHVYSWASTPADLRRARTSSSEADIRCASCSRTDSPPRCAFA